MPEIPNYTRLFVSWFGKLRRIFPNSKNSERHYILMLTKLWITTKDSWIEKEKYMLENLKNLWNYEKFLPNKTLLLRQTLFSILGMIADASPGFFSGGWTPRPLKGYHAPPAGGPGGEGPPDGSEVSFFKTIQSIWKWIEFSKISIFFLPQKPFFLRKNSKNWTNLTRIYEFFRKIFENFQILWNL